MQWNTALFKLINRLVGRNRFLDAFGRAGAEWGVVVMVGWYITSSLIATDLSLRAALWPLGAFAIGVLCGWAIDIGIGSIVREPRPHVTHPDSKLLFTPMMSWKSFPSDHGMVSWLLVGLAFVFQLPGVEVLAILALWVSWGRVYAGVHYPFDIIGGATVAALLTVLTYYSLVLFV